MSSLRLTFLYPHLFRSIRVSEAAARRCCSPRGRQRATFATTPQKREQFVERHGKAVEPFLQPGETEKDVKVFMPEPNSEPVKKSNAKRSKKTAIVEGGVEDGSTNTDQVQVPPLAPPSEDSQSATPVGGDSTPGNQQVSLSNQEGIPPGPSPADIAPPGNGPLNQVLSFELPASPHPDNLHMTHLHPPQYVHNFDSWTLVKEVEKGGFSPEQSITAMKAVRALLAKNLDVAKEGLVSKSDVENETYLFRAACSELRTEIQNTRRASDEQMRRERNLVQHEVDILNQKLTQEMLTLKDELTGMFNDRKMAVRMDQREMDSSIQELNYEITVALNSDSKSEVEGLRWVLTRRAVLALVVMALMVLSSLRYASYRTHEEEMEQKRQERLMEVDMARRSRQREKDAELVADEGSQTEDLDRVNKDLSAGVAAEVLAAN